MLVRYADWKKPTDGDYAFRLRPVGTPPTGFVPHCPPVGVRSDIRTVALQVLETADALRFEQRVERWTGPEDEGGEPGEHPYQTPARMFEERPWSEVLDAALLETVLRGTSLVWRHPEGRVDYLLRDHHMLDVALYQYWSSGELPRALFHADRHSDWCTYSYLEARRPQQAATWWALFEGLKRPEHGAPVLRLEDVHFTTARAALDARMAGRDVGASTRVPLCVDDEALDWRSTLEREDARACDWVSLDLDNFSPSAQLALTGGLLRDARFHALLERARVRVFVLSPQFLRGGERIERWTLQGGLHSARRLVNLLRSPSRLTRLRAAPDADPPP